MDTLVDYIRWMGDFPIAATGFRDADALVLCTLIYANLSPVFSSGAESYTVSDCRGAIESGQLRITITGGEEDYLALVAAAAESKRFGALHMRDYADVFREDPPLQFSAVCFEDDTDLSFLAFRGTDSTLAGWEEDFMISFRRTEAQELARRYAEEHIVPGRRWYLGGHSKGSNLALYAACLLGEEKWEAVEHVYLLDGPGLCPEVLDQDLVGRIDGKTTQIVPGFCVVGKLFAPQVSDTRIIRADESGFMQHSIASWGIDHGKPARIEEHEMMSRFVAETMDGWIKGISQEDRVVFVGELFDALAAGGADTLGEIRKGGRAGIEAIIRSLSGASEITKQTLTDLPKYAIKMELGKFFDLFSPEGDEEKEKAEDAEAAVGAEPEKVPL